MKLSAEVNSGAAYLMSLGAVVAIGIIKNVPFSELFMGIGTMYCWHTGRRLLKEIKLGEKNGNGDIKHQGQDTSA